MRGDINGDGYINANDEMTFYSQIGRQGRLIPADLNGDKIVNNLDLPILQTIIANQISRQYPTASPTSVPTYFATATPSVSLSLYVP